MEPYHSVAVIGAGAAGLFCASQLRSRFPDVIVLEAQDHVGGRIRQAHGMAPWPIEMGPEFVHGANSVLVDMAKEHGITFQEREWPDFWHFGESTGGAGLVFDGEVDEEIEKIHDIFESAASEGASKRMIAAADASYANDFCCSLEQLGLRELIEEGRGWRYRETYLCMDHSMGFVVDRLSAGLDIKTNWPLEHISYSAEGALLTCVDGRRLRAGKVVIAVPLNVMRDGLINFIPSLPQPKLDAIQRVRMGNVVKILLTFSRQFWPEGMYDIICPDSFVPELWMLRYDNAKPTQTGAASAGAVRWAREEKCRQDLRLQQQTLVPAPTSSSEPAQQQASSNERNTSNSSTTDRFPHVLVGFIAGTRADEASKLRPDEVVTRFLDQIDKVFGKPGDLTPATASLAQSRVIDWSKEKYVRGAYSYPTLGAELGDRCKISSSVMGTLFFAGEHCNPDIGPTVQGAIETGQRAALELEAVLKFRYEECMIYDVTMYEPFTGSFVALPDAHNTQARYDFDITSPSGVRIHELQGQAEGKFHLVPYETGRYKFCMRLNQERSGARYVLTREVVWDLHIGHPDPAMHDNVKENETQALWAYVHLVDSQLQQLKATQLYLYWRERRHRQTVDSTKQRVLWYAAGRASTLAFVSIAQVFVIRRMFSK
ncbi:MAG: hypothetical protein WDW38_007611 [Sanguina aurantia]